jgi:transcriptional regulator with XRE-family HTH domain
MPRSNAVVNIKCGSPEFKCGMANKSSTKDLSSEERVALARRVRDMVEAIGTQPKAAEVARVSLRQLEQYLSGNVAPSLLAAGNLAAATGFSLDWVLTGTGNRLRSSEPDRLANPLDAEIRDTEEILCIARLLQPALAAYSEAGASLSAEDEDAIVGDTVDALRELGRGESGHCFQKLVSAAIEAHRAVAPILAARSR